MRNDKYKQEVKDIHSFVDNIGQKGVEFKIKDSKLKFKDGLKVITGGERRMIKKFNHIIKPLLFGCSHCPACAQWDWGDYKGNPLCAGVSWFFGRAKKPKSINDCKCPLVECLEDYQ